MRFTDKKGLTTFEISPDGDVKEAEYKRGGVFISFSEGNSETNETFLLDKKDGCRYVKALNLKNAIRKNLTSNLWKIDGCSF